MKSVGIAQQNI